MFQKKGVNSNEKTRDRRGFLRNRSSSPYIFCKITLGQLSGGGTRVLGHHLLQSAFYLVSVTEAALSSASLYSESGTLACLGIQLRNLGECLACTLQIALVPGSLQPNQYWALLAYWAVRVFAQESGKGLAGLVEILGLDQVEGSIVIELFLRRISRLATLASRRCLNAAAPRLRQHRSAFKSPPAGRILRSRGRCSTGFLCADQDPGIAPGFPASCAQPDSAVLRSHLAGAISDPASVAVG